MGIIGGGFALLLGRVISAVFKDSSDENTPAKAMWGHVILALAVAGGIATLLMDTSVDTSSGRVNNLGLMKDQQNYLMVCGVMAIIGTILVVQRR